MVSFVDGRVDYLFIEPGAYLGVRSDQRGLHDIVITTKTYTFSRLAR